MIIATLVPHVNSKDVIEWEICINDDGRKFSVETWYPSGVAERVARQTYRADDVVIQNLKK